MTNNADPNQLASSEASWSESALFAKAGHIQVQQNQIMLFFYQNNINTQEFLYDTEFVIAW